MMKKYNIIILTIFLSIFLIPFSIALDNSSIVAYYGFEDSSLSIIQDSTNIYNLTNLSGSTNPSKTNGIVGQAINIITNQSKFSNISKLDDKGNFSINFWTKITNTSSSNQIFYYTLGNYTATTNQYGFYKISASSYYTLSKYVSPTGETDSALTPIYNDTWFMITLVYSNTSSIKYYINGILSHTTTFGSMETYPSGLTYFILGYPLTTIHNTTIDELSLWNISLSTLDMSELYNGGLGLNYNQTSGVQSIPITARCINSNTYCNQPSYSYLYPNEIFCSISNTSNCANGCSEETGVAVCSNNCVNECNVIGQTMCNTTTSISECDDGNGDGCFEWNPHESCSIGTFCLQSYNIATCNNVTQNGTHNNYGLSVIPYTSSNSNTSYTDNPSTRTVTINTIYNVHNQNFYTSGTTYISRTCDYKELSLFSQGYHNITSISEYMYNITSAVNSDSIIRISLIPQFDNTSLNSEGNIRLISSGGILNSQLYYIRNSTAKSLCILDQFNGSIIYCDYGTNSYDDLHHLILEYSFVFASKSYSTKITFDRDVDNIIIINPKTFLGDDIFKINITSTTNPTDMIEIVGLDVTDYTSFTSNTGGTTIEQIIDLNCNCGTITCIEYKAIHGTQAYANLCNINHTIQNFVKPCSYTTTGLFRVRTYGNNLGTPDYSVYTDYYVNINAYGLTESQVDDLNNNDYLIGSGLANWIKYAIILFVLGLIFGGMYFIGLETKSQKLTTVMSMVLSFIAVIMFVLLGWIPSWIIVLVILVMVFGIIFVSKSSNVATG